MKRIGHFVFSAFLFSWTAAAQYIPPVSGPTCVEVPGIPCPGQGSSSSSSGGTSDPISVWTARWAAWREQREARKQVRQQALEDASQRLRQQFDAHDQLEQQAATQRMLQLNSQHYKDDLAARQREKDEQAQQLQDDFNRKRQATLGALMDDGIPAPVPAHGGFSAPAAPVAQAAAPVWTASITDPALKPMAHRLASIVPPLPIPAKEAALDWKKIYLNDDRLMNTTDLVFAGWEILGTLGSSAVLPCKVLLIAGKSFIAQENGAYLYLVEKDKDYDAALAYLKNPAQAKAFAQIVQAVRQNRPLPAGATPSMAQAARAIADPGLGDTGKMVWDAMTSKPALSAMVRKAVLEVGMEILTPSTDTALLEDAAEREAIFNTLRLERTRARKMMAEATTTMAQQRQLKTLVQQSDKLSAELYKVDKFNHLLAGATDTRIGDSMSEASDLIADHFLGPEAKGREY